MKRKRRDRKSGRWGVALVCALLLAAGWAAGARAQEAERSMLMTLQHGSVSERLAALEWLAENGGQDSAAIIVSSLRDGDTMVRQLAESALWSIWTRSGDPATDELLKMGSYLMVNGKVEQSVDIFSQIITDHPEFAEGYNKRATALYLLGSYEKSMEDIELTLARNPFHFGALSGAGYCMLKLQRMEEAVRFLERALEINPNMEGVKELLEETRRKLDKRAI